MERDLKIHFNKKLLFYLQLGVVSATLMGCNKKISNNVQNVDIQEKTDITKLTDLDTVEVTWNNPENYRIIERNGEPYFVLVSKKTITDMIDVIYYVPDGYEIIENNGIKYGVMELEDGTKKFIVANFKLPADSIGYKIGYINGIPYGIKEKEITVLTYLKADYELPEGYNLQYIDGRFVGVKSGEYQLEEDAAKVLQKINNL